MSNLFANFFLYLLNFSN